MAIADWINYYGILDHEIDPKYYLSGTYTSIDGYDVVKKVSNVGKPFVSHLKKSILIVGDPQSGSLRDREEDAEAAETAKIPFIGAEKFREGFIWQLIKRPIK